MGLVGAVAMFLPAASVEFGFSGKSHSLVPIRDSFDLAALPLGVSACLIACALAGLLTRLPPSVLIVVALLATTVGGVRGLDVAAGFNSNSDTQGSGAGTSGPKEHYGDDLFAALVKLSAEHTGTPARDRNDRPGEEVGADVFWGPGWSLFVGLTLALSTVLAVRSLWTLLPLWAALPLGVVPAVGFWLFVALMSVASHGGFD